ncbi:MAG: hypothetical protein A3H96_11420 [Acidobacteria bacterium RIFCSPLOWO2_02_FULL_67_36]|nr:MAG: hypothetical protein A3H96_11420 [Acidobacteria bacterium RIFCSPLOWO2_02_FULL_67_36]OGA76297.1 MAG: hypothetical protein A3G27_05795 [Betaproteobacteria bacterium RIFCSPLOWO2_12_FULL_66_14]
MAEELINELTGEAQTPAEYITSLRRLERSVTRLDDTIAGLGAELKAARQAREKAVALLRSAIREIKAMSRASKRQAVKS